MGLFVQDRLAVLRALLTILRVRSLETPLRFYNSQTEHDTETKLTSINFSCLGAEGLGSSWLRVLGNQLIYCPP